MEKEKVIAGELELEFVAEYGQIHGIVSLFNESSEEISLYKEWNEFIGDKVKITIQRIDQ